MKYANFLEIHCLMPVYVLLMNKIYLMKYSASPEEAGMQFLWTEEQEY